MASIAAEQGPSEAPEDFVRRLFQKNTYESLAQYRSSLQQQIAATDEDVRDVIGSRYKELIQTCDMVVGTEEVCGAIRQAYRAHTDASFFSTKNPPSSEPPLSSSTEPLWRLLLSERVVREVCEVVARVEEKVTSLQLFLEACASAHSDTLHLPHHLEAAASAFRMVVGAALRTIIVATSLHALGKEMLPQSQVGDPQSPRSLRGGARTRNAVMEAVDTLGAAISRLSGLLSHTLCHTIPNRFYASIRQHLILLARTPTKAAVTTDRSFIGSYVDFHVCISIVLWTVEDASMASPFSWNGSTKANPLESHGNAALCKMVALHWSAAQSLAAEKASSGRLGTAGAEAIKTLVDRLASYLASIHKASTGLRAGNNSVPTFIDKELIENILSRQSPTDSSTTRKMHQGRADELLEAVKGGDKAVSDEDFLDMMLQYVTEDSNKGRNATTQLASTAQSPTGIPTLAHNFGLFSDVSATRQGSPDKRAVGGCDSRITITQCVQESLLSYFTEVRKGEGIRSSLGDTDPASVRLAFPTVVLGLLRAQDVLLQRYGSAAQISAFTPSCVFTNGMFVPESLFTAQALLWFGGESVAGDGASTSVCWEDVKKEADLYTSYQIVLMEVVLAAGRVGEGGKARRDAKSPATILPTSLSVVFKECVVGALASLQAEHKNNASSVKGGGVTRWGSWSPSPLRFNPNEEPSGNTPLRARTSLATGYYSISDVAQVTTAISMGSQASAPIADYHSFAMEVLGSATLLSGFHMNLAAATKRLQRDLAELVTDLLAQSNAPSTSSMSIEKEASSVEKSMRLLGVFASKPVVNSSLLNPPALEDIQTYWDHEAWVSTLNANVSRSILSRVQSAVNSIGDEFDGILSYALVCFNHSPYKHHCSASPSTSGSAPFTEQISFPPIFLAPHYLPDPLPPATSANPLHTPTNTSLILNSVMARRRAANKATSPDVSTPMERNAVVHGNILHYLITIRNLLTSLDSPLVLAQLQEQQRGIHFDRARVVVGRGGGDSGAGSPSPRRDGGNSSSKEFQDGLLKQSLAPLYNRVCALAQRIEATFSKLIFKLLVPSSDDSVRHGSTLHTDIAAVLAALCQQIEASVERIASEEFDGVEGNPTPDSNRGPAPLAAALRPHQVILANVAAPILHILLLQLQYSPISDVRAKGPLQTAATEALLPFGQHVQHLYVVCYQDCIAAAAARLRSGLRSGFRDGLLHRCSSVTHSSQRRNKALAELHSAAPVGLNDRVVLDMNGLALSRFRSSVQSRLWVTEEVRDEGSVTTVAFPSKPVPEASVHLLHGLMFDLLHTSSLGYAVDVVLPVLLSKLRSVVVEVLAEMLDEGAEAMSRELVAEGRGRSNTRSARSSRAISPASSFAASSIGGEVNIDILRDECNMTTCEYDDCFGCCEEYFVQLAFEAEYLCLCLSPASELAFRVMTPFKPTPSDQEASPRGRSNSTVSENSTATSHEVAIATRFQSAIHYGSADSNGRLPFATNTARRMAWAAANKAWIGQVRSLLKEIEDHVDVVTWALCETRVSAAAAQHFEATRHLIPWSWCGTRQSQSPTGGNGPARVGPPPVPISTTLPVIEHFQLLPVTLPIDAASATVSLGQQRVSMASPFVQSELNSLLVLDGVDGTTFRGYADAKEKATRALKGLAIQDVDEVDDAATEGNPFAFLKRDAGSPLPLRGASQAAISQPATEARGTTYPAGSASTTVATSAPTTATTAAAGATIASSLKNFWGWQ